MARISTLDVQRCSIGISAYEVKLILSVLYMNMENKQSREIDPSPSPPPKERTPPPRGVILDGMSLLLMDLLVIAVQEIIDCNLKNDSIGCMNDQI